MFTLIYRFLADIYAILMTKHIVCSRIELLRTYLKINLKYYFLVKILGLRLTQEKVFGYSMHFLDSITFRHLWNEIFVTKEYRFDGPEPQIIVDCGSNIGLSILYFKMSYPHARILAFEPDRRTFKILKRNIEANKFDKVELYEAAVGNTEGKVPFFSAVEDDPYALAEMSMFRSSLGIRKVMQHDVNCVKLSSFIEGSIDFLKLDVQGAEGQVIEDLSRTDKLRAVKQLVLEYHYDPDNLLLPILAKLEKNGFKFCIHPSPFPPYYDYKNKQHCFMIYAYNL